MVQAIQASDIVGVSGALESIVTSKCVLATNTSSISITAIDDAYSAAVGALSKAGYAVVPMKDVAGMAVMRTVAMLVNEAADAVHQGVCTSADLDLAMGGQSFH
ncbi:3-hydroxy-acyl-CoA dehydrogenase [Caballeronia catudaia]|uniref:3-hydroxy-acyl-CoA dehydrogenase n=1 Tax=Caballeronia catudaia TaxID=1777136 RepID=A0A158D8Y8_9BURK|nr:3-hydroxy-acyl-CoA dehydrogenase [Caballeronia catudaia]